MFTKYKIKFLLLNRILLTFRKTPGRCQSGDPFPRDAGWDTAAGKRGGTDPSTGHPLQNMVILHNRVGLMLIKVAYLRPAAL